MRRTGEGYLLWQVETADMYVTDVNVTVYSSLDAKILLKTIWK